MTPKEQIQALEAIGITRYRISCDTGINEKTLCNWAKGKTAMKSNKNVDILDKYYKKVIGKLNDCINLKD